MKKPTYNDSIFINCPFDENYYPLFRAIIFTVYRCGFFPYSALAEDNGLENRLSKIEKLIEQSRYGIHDLSRTELNENGLPRFNMPFELGLFFSAKKFGDTLQKNKNALIFDISNVRYLEFISDLRGVDIKAHANDYNAIVRSIRNWLSTSSRRKNIPGQNIIIQEYEKFVEQLPEITQHLGYDLNNIPFNDFCAIVEDWLGQTLPQ